MRTGRIGARASLLWRSANFQVGILAGWHSGIAKDARLKAGATHFKNPSGQTQSCVKIELG